MLTAMLRRVRGGELLYLGVDGGGSKCRAVIARADGTVLASATGGPANAFQDARQAIESIMTATGLALEQAGLGGEAMRELHACCGLAGVSIPAAMTRMNAWRHPFADLIVTTDLHVACVGAHRGDDGAVIIVGTGSCGYAHVRGRRVSYGGHGFPCGDRGSGAWIGLEAARVALLAHDGFAAPTALTARVMQALGVADADAVVVALKERGVAGYAALAPEVFAAADGGDASALAIVGEAAAYIDALARKLARSRPPRLSLLGGLAGKLQPWLAPDVAARLAPPLETAELGAVRLAVQRHASAGLRRVAGAR